MLEKGAQDASGAKADFVAGESKYLAEESTVDMKEKFCRTDAVVFP